MAKWHLVEAHAGTIDAHSEGKGRGALFTVRLPHLLGETVPARAPVPSGSIADVKVLYVDDAVDVLETLVLMLEPMGAVVRTARSVEEALPIVESFHPQVILADLAMPERDGYDLLRTVRQLPSRDASIPVIALTAYTRAEDAANAVRAGFAGHVGKPVDAGVLASTIASVMPAAS